MPTIECLERITEIQALNLDFTYVEWGTEYYVRLGNMMRVDR